MKRFFDNAVNKSKRHKAFTMAEVLIVLAVIGVIAAITIPSLIEEYQKSKYIAELKESYATIQQGFKLMIASQGVIQLDQTSLYGANPVSSYAGASVVDEAIRKYFKTTKTCFWTDSSCQIAGYKSLKGGTVTDPEFADLNNFYLTSGAVARLQLLDTCSPNASGEGPIKSWCGWLYIDTNGAKAPNQWGRDYFRFAISNDGLLYPGYGEAFAKFQSGSTWATSANYWGRDNSSCGVKGTTSVTNASGNGCAARIMEEAWEMNY